MINISEFQADSRTERTRSYSFLISAIALELVTTTSRLQGNSDFREFKIPSPPIPNFPSSLSPRYVGAYGETVFPVLFFVDGRVCDGQLNLTVARGFFQNSSMPGGFFRANRSIGLSKTGDLVETVFSAHPIQPGKNQGRINNYVLDLTLAKLNSSGCLSYDKFVNEIVPSLYPNPTGAFRDALNINLDNFYIPHKGSSCLQTFPFGQ